MFSLTFGMGVDGHLVKMDLEDPNPLPTVIIGKSGAGKTNLLKAIALAAQRKNVIYYVLTDLRAEWADVDTSWKVIPFSKGKVSLRRLADQLNSIRKEPTLLLIDGLDQIQETADREAFHMLFRDGPCTGLWPVVTIETSKITDTMIANLFLPTKHVTIFGQTNQPEILSALKIKDVKLSGLRNGQFVLEDNVRFWPISEL